MQNNNSLSHIYGLEKRSAVITGASRGIGRAISLALANLGVTLTIGARDKNALQFLKKEIELINGSCFAHVVDVSNENSVADFLNAAESNMGKVDILINNAGIYETEPVLDHSLDKWQRILDTNLTSALLTSRKAVKKMIESNWGRVINISSISGKVGEAFASAYSASKFGLIGFTQSFAQEVARYNITVNAICPGWVNTKMAIDQLRDDFYLNLTEQEKSHSIDNARLSVPQMRFIEPDEIASLAIYLCSDQAKGITGQAINICGGLSLH